MRTNLSLSSASALFAAKLTSGGSFIELESGRGGPVGQSWQSKFGAFEKWPKGWLLASFGPVLGRKMQHQMQRPLAHWPETLWLDERQWLGMRKTQNAQEEQSADSPQRQINHLYSPQSLSRVERVLASDFGRDWPPLFADTVQSEQLGARRASQAREEVQFGRAANSAASLFFVPKLQASTWRPLARLAPRSWPTGRRKLRPTFAPQRGAHKAANQAAR